MHRRRRRFIEKQIFLVFCRRFNFFTFIAQCATYVERLRSTGHPCRQKSRKTRSISLPFKNNKMPNPNTPGSALHESAAEKHFGKQAAVSAISWAAIAPDAL